MNLHKWADWVNPLFTATVFAVNTDTLLKVLAFLFVTAPLGIYQWWKLIDRWKERRSRNGQ